MKFRILFSIAAIVLIAACATTPHRLTDSEIAMIMRVVNIGEVREGELAREKGADTMVRDFGATMVSEHASQNSKAESELARANIASEDTDLSRQIDATSGVATERLRALTGREFDRAYVDRQVEAHQYVLGLIDSTLMPAAKKKVVIDQLTELRKTIERHLARLKQIQSSLPR